MDRRSFFKLCGVAALSSAAPAQAEDKSLVNDEEFSGILIDTTRCVGCQTCSLSCAEAHGHPEPDLDILDEQAGFRPTTPDEWTVINRFETDESEIFIKRQCMHCNQPACASACPTKAMLKTEAGPVIWRADKCMGCRYCMISCPFDIPKFDYDNPVPSINKCVMCFERLEQNELPACVENCPEEALMFGPRRELLREAHRRIALDPDTYIDHIYGEHEAGGTSMLYLASVPFEQLGMKSGIDHAAYPEFTKTFLYSVPIVLTLWPPLLLALNRATEPESDEIIEKDTEESWKH